MQPLGPFNESDNNYKSLKLFLYNFDVNFCAARELEKGKESWLNEFVLKSIT